MLLAIATGETLYWAHRLRRFILFSPLTGMAVGVGIMVIRNWRYILHLTHHP